MGAHRNTESQTNLSRLTIDIPKKTHTHLKAIAALQGKSMREYVSDLIKQALSNRVPNQETLRAIADVENEKDLVKAKDVLDLFDKLDI